MMPLAIEIWLESKDSVILGLVNDMRFLVQLSSPLPFGRVGIGDFGPSTHQSTADLKVQQSAEEATSSYLTCMDV
jgi:hypothetical protein